MARNKFDVDEELDTPFQWAHLKRLAGYLKPHRKTVALTVMFMMTAAFLSLSVPYILKLAFDRAIPHKDIPDLIRLSAMLVGVSTVAALCGRWRIRMMSDVGNRIIEALRTDIFTHLQKLPLSYFDSRPHGKILVRVVNYVNSLSDLLSNGLVTFLTDVFSLFVIIIYMLMVDVRLTLVSLAGMPLLFLSIMAIRVQIRRRWQAYSRKQSNITAYIHESICGMKVTQSFAREEENAAIFAGQADENRRVWMRAVRFVFLMWPSVEFISNLVVCAIYVSGVYWLSNGMTVGVLVAFLGYVWRFWQPIQNIANFNNALVNGMAYMERIFETIDEPLTVTDKPGAGLMPEVEGHVVFEHVNFSYDEGRPILKDFSLDVRPGETIALVGPTGAGKTTVTSLLSRFYDLDSGVISIDGHDISNVTLQSLRRQMGVMLQDTFLFSGSIRENIRYARPDATDEEVEAAAKAVRADDFIRELPEGYDTAVNERGSRLSVGQRQLVSFARAILADPRVLILDEATSSIDTRTECLLQEGLDKLLEGRTAFVIAHRLSTIRNADRIVVIDDGRIAEAGTHDELMTARGHYYRLYMAQYQFLEQVG